ncbi:MAG: arsenate reductase family protein [Bdellovibrionota bacterium]
MKLKFYSYKKCSTCTKASQFLKSIEVDVKPIDITENPPSKSDLRKMLKFYDGNLKKLFNTSGVLYREMKIADKLKSMDLDEAIDLLSENGKLVKRPFILTQTFGLVGFKKEEWESVFCR